VLLHPTNHRIDASTGRGTSAPYELVPHAAMKGAPQSVGGAACAPVNAPPRIPTRGRQLPVAACRSRRVGLPGAHSGDANAPPERALWLPDAPSSPMVRASEPLDRGGFFWPSRRHTDSYEHAPYSLCAPPGGAQSGRRATPPGPVRRPRGCRRRRPPAHWTQYSGPTHAPPWNRSPRWPEKSARAGARPHTGSTRQQSVQTPHFSTDHNPAIRNNAS
jgi:hypothetical protein